MKGLIVGPTVINSTLKKKGANEVKWSTQCDDPVSFASMSNLFADFSPFFEGKSSLCIDYFAPIKS